MEAKSKKIIVFEKKVEKSGAKWSKFIIFAHRII